MVFAFECIEEEIAIFSVLLADDNVIALKHFTNIVNWESLGFQLVGTAVNGIDAYKKFESLRPDLVITDVQMPGMNGLELAQKIHAASPKAVIIFLSSFDEFDYARAAVHLNVRDYILKHELDAPTMTEKLIAIRNELQKQNESSYEMTDFQVYLSFHSPIEDLDIALRKTDPSARDDYSFFILEQDHIPEPLAKISGLQIPEADYKTLIPGILREIPIPMHLARFDNYRWVGVYAANTGGTDVQKQVQRLAESMAGVSFTLFIFPMHGTLSQCRNHYEKRLYLFEQKYFENPGSILFSELCEPPKASSEAKAAIPIHEALDDRDMTAFEQSIQDMLIAYDYDALIAALCESIAHLQKVVEENQLSISLFEDDADQFLTLSRCVRWLKQKIRRVQDILNPERSESVNRAVFYISQHYGNAMLGLEDIAQAAGISVNRLNEVFKREMRETVGRYLTRIRMEKARELLADPKTRIPQAARLSGYSSASYFAHVFKKTWGTSPQAYQRESTAKR